jgi:anti-sigma regulatory factor (Ser/Thr protein kinase)
MPQTTPSVHITVHDDSIPTRTLRHAIDELGVRYGLSADELFDLKLAATEALTNALKGSVGGHPVDVAVAESDGAVEVAVRSHGVFELGDPGLAGSESEGGRGIPLMFALVDEVEFASTREGTLVRLRKRLNRRVRGRVTGPRPAVT